MAAEQQDAMQAEGRRRCQRARLAQRRHTLEGVVARRDSLNGAKLKGVAAVGQAEGLAPPRDSLNGAKLEGVAAVIARNPPNGAKLEGVATVNVRDLPNGAKLEGVAAVSACGRRADSGVELPTAPFCCACAIGQSVADVDGGRAPEGATQDARLSVGGAWQPVYSLSAGCCGKCRLFPSGARQPFAAEQQRSLELWFWQSLAARDGRRRRRLSSREPLSAAGSSTYQRVTDGSPGGGKGRDETTE